MSRKLLGIVIGGSLGGLLFVFIMVLVFSPGVFLKARIKKGLDRTFGGRAQVEGLAFGWKRGLELYNFILLKEEDRKPAFRAKGARFKFLLRPLLRGQYTLREAVFSDVEVTGGLQIRRLSWMDVFMLRASHITFTGELGMSRTTGQEETKGSKRLVGKGHIEIRDGRLKGQFISALMEGLGQSGEGPASQAGGYAFESISTDFEAGGEGEVYLSNFLAKGALFDLELEGWIRADQGMDCDAVVLISGERVGEKLRKLFSLSDSGTLRLPIRLRGSLSRPTISIKTESLVEELFKGIFQKK